MMDVVPSPSVLKVEYKKAKLHRRFLAFFIDLFLLAFLTGIFFGVCNTFVPNLPFYAEVVATRKQLQEESLLYESSTEEDIATYIANTSALATITEKKEYLSSRLSAFYANAKFVSVAEARSYEERKAKATKDGVSLFEMKEGELVEKSLSPAYFITFYSEEVTNHALSILSQYPDYFHSSQVIFLTSFFEIIILLTLNFSFLNFVVPVCIFRKGRRTFGRAVFKIGILNKRALSPRKRAYLARAILEFLFLIVLDFFAFLIPLMISVTMLLLSNDSQSLVDYLTGQYMVDMSKDDIYDDPYQFQGRADTHEHSLLEDKDFQIEQNHI